MTASSSMPAILFVCTGNQFRSPLAEAFMKQFIRQGAVQGQWRVESAGTWAADGQPAAAIARQIAERLGLPGLDTHRSRPVSQQLLDQFDLILVMEIGHREAIASEFRNARGRARLLGELVDGISYSIEDATGETRSPEDVVSELQGLIQRGGQRILKLAESLYHSRHPKRTGNS